MLCVLFTFTEDNVREANIAPSHTVYQEISIAKQFSRLSATAKINARIFSMAK